MCLSPKAQKHQTGCVLSWVSTDTQAVESVQTQKCESGIVRISEGTDTTPRFWRNAQRRFSV